MGGQGVNITGVPEFPSAFRDRNLPKQVTDRLTALTNIVAFGEAAVDAVHTTHQSIRASRGEAEGRLAQVVDPRRDVRGMTAEELEAEKTEAQSEVERWKAAEEQSVLRRKALSRKLNADKRLLRKVHALLASTTDLAIVAPKS
jgi:hypothetical protein